MQSQGFSRADVELLKSSPSEPVKINLIDKLNTSLRFEDLSGSEKIVAQEIIRFLASDISANVRMSIATKFCDTIVLPYDIAVKLANDLEDIVAMPIIQNSTVLADKDLISIIEQGNIQRQKAVASRARLSEQLCTHLVNRTSGDVLITLVNNNNSQLSRSNSEAIIRKNSNNQPLMKAMIASKKITVEQAHELLTMVSGDLQKLLIIEYNISGNVASTLIHDSKETLIINMIASNLETRNQNTCEQMVSRLCAENELTFSVLVKALSLGNLNFFETGLARLAGLSMDELKEKIWSNEKEFKTVYRQCHMPESMADAIYKMIHIAAEETSNDSPEVARLCYRILNRLARASNNEKILNLDYLVTIVAHNLKKSNLL